MKKNENKLKDFCYLVNRWLTPIFNPIKVLYSLPRYFRYFVDMKKYSNMPGSEKIVIFDTYPCIHDKTVTTLFDSHYFYQDRWAFKKIFDSGTPSHVDVGSNVVLISFLSAICKVTFIDLRPLNVNISNLESRHGTILEMPFPDNSISSLSSLHVAEHIGLGRYGDPIDPTGTKKSCDELVRVLADDGNLYFSLPVGKPRLCFNAHRIHSPYTILEYFKPLKLVELSGIDDAGNFINNIDIKILEKCSFGCGFFHFKKTK